MPNNSKKTQSKLTSRRQSYIPELKTKIFKNNFSTILALHGNGKTTLLKEITTDENFVYIDMKRIATSPENFSVDMIGNICYFLIPNHKKQLINFQNIEFLKELKLPENSKSVVNKIDNELQKIKPDQAMVVELGIRFAETLSKELNSKTVFCLDNFEEVLPLNNFSQIDNILEIFIRTSSANSHAKFLTASSSVNLFKNALKQYDGIHILELAEFDKKETKEVFENIAGKTDERIITETYKATSGIPIAIQVLANKFKEIKTNKIETDITSLNHILFGELCTINSKLFNYSESLFHHSLNRARGASLLKSILKITSLNPSLRLSEIARLIYRSSPVTKSLLERLIEVDLIIKIDNKFEFANPILKQWCKLMFKGIEFENIPDKSELESVGGLE